MTKKKLKSNVNDVIIKRTIEHYCMLGIIKMRQSKTKFATPKVFYSSKHNFLKTVI